ncbi:tetratricopeptide repeat protein [Candidatus Dependentiae bacterium]|nr:tetratricopeptide repeat protein [Candidatus Dependentiae bacterium]
MSLQNAKVRRHGTGESSKIQQFWYSLLPPGILALFTTLLYLPSLTYPFQFDDIANISKKFAIRFDNPFSRWWGSSRWVGEWLNTVNYQIGGFDPFSYRLFNLIIHIAAGVLLYFLIQDLCKYLKSKPFFYENRLYIAFCTAAFFLLHPVQTQTVSYVIQARLEGLASLFILATLYLFVRAMTTPSIVARGILIASFFFFGFLSCGTKEIVVVLPFLLFLIDWFFLAEENWSNFKQRLWLHITFDLFFAGLMAHYMGAKFAVDALSMKLSTGNNRGNILTQRAFDVITPFHYLISEFKVVVHYIFMFVWPFNISVEYDWKLATRFFSPDVIFPFLVLLSLVGTALRCIFKKEYTFFAFGLFWFLISIAPRATIIPSPELACDYKTYLSSVGVLFILAVIFVFAVRKAISYFQNVEPRFADKQLQLAVFSLLMVPIALSAYSRNKVWETCVAFWEDNAVKAPGKARVHNNLGVAYSEAGKIDEALAAYKKAIDLDALYSDPLSNIAVAYSMKGDLDKAIESLEVAIHICPNYPEAYNNLGTLLLQKKQYDDAERYLNAAIQLRPYYGKAYYNLARMHEEQGRPEEAWQFLKRAVEGDLDNPEVFYKFGQMSLKVQKYAEAIQAFEFVAQQGFNDQSLWFNLANAYFMVNQHDKAETLYEKLVRDYPLDGRYAYNLGETYFIKKDFERALALFEKVATLPRPLPQSFFRVANCLEQLQRHDDALSFLEDTLKRNPPEDFKKMVQNEITRMTLQQKVTEGNGSIRLSDLKQAFAAHTPKSEDKQPATKQTANTTQKQNKKIA